MASNLLFGRGPLLSGDEHGRFFGFLLGITGAVGDRETGTSGSVLYCFSKLMISSSSLEDSSLCCAGSSSSSSLQSSLQICC